MGLQQMVARVCRGPKSDLAIGPGIDRCASDIIGGGGQVSCRTWLSHHTPRGTKRQPLLWGMYNPSKIQTLPVGREGEYR
jgi:hypothetical protein